MYSCKSNEEFHTHGREGGRKGGGEEGGRGEEVITFPLWVRVALGCMFFGSESMHLCIEV